MIKIFRATYLRDYLIKLEFSDGNFSEYDFSYLLTKKSQLTEDLENIEYFKLFFLELGAICWKNGLELSADSLYEKAKNRGILSTDRSVA